MNVPRFPGEVRVPLLNPLNGKTYTLERADAVSQTPDVLADLVAACNEPPIYHWLFAERLSGQPYDEAQARSFFRWLRSGWQDNAYFVFVLLSPCGRLVGALDIKSADLQAAEVGYWLSGRHRGLMTLAVQALEAVAQDAGYRWLYARIRPENERSLAVVHRAGWIEGELEEGGTHVRYMRQLA